MNFLQGSMALVSGLVALVGALVLRQVTRDEQMRRDLTGAAWHFVVFLVIRTFGYPLEQAFPLDWHPYLRVTWELSFAFGMVRLFVAVALGIRRSFNSTPTAKIHRDVADFVLYVVTAIPILKMQLKLDVTTMLGTSAVLSLVLGFALQDTLGNLFSGLSLQLERPFRTGDFIRVGIHEGRVVQISWRSMRIETVRGEVVTLPNTLIAKEPVINFSRGGQPVAIDLSIGVAYEAPPTLVKSEISAAVAECPVFLSQPVPLVRLMSFGDSAQTFTVRAWIQDPAAVPQAHDELWSRIWYRFARAGIEIPYPQRVITTRAQAIPRKQLREEVLGALDVFSLFSPSELSEMAREAKEVRFGAGERIVTEGHEGESYFAVMSGELSVRVGTPPSQVATLKRGMGFGEMSLLTGEPRAATIVAITDCELLQFDREAFSRHFAAHPELAGSLATLLSKRKAELAAAASVQAEPGARDASRILERLRKIFGIKTEK